jgi:hypothetical protein
MLYKIDDNIKNYAISIVVGATYGDISIRYLFESFVLFLLGQSTGVFLFRFYAVYSYIYQGYNNLEIQTLKSGFLLNILFFVVTAVFLLICVNAKLQPCIPHPWK